MTPLALLRIVRTIVNSLAESDTPTRYTTIARKIQNILIVEDINEN